MEPVRNPNLETRGRRNVILEACVKTFIGVETEAVLALLEQQWIEKHIDVLAETQHGGTYVTALYKESN